MGADQFVTSVTDCDDAAAAFAIAVERAAWEHGHGGYTGTIAEKDEFITVEPPAGVDGETVVDEITENCYVQKGHYRMLEHSEQLLEWYGLRRAEQILAAYDDKWGPAVAVRTSTGWTFIGWASC